MLCENCQETNKDSDAGNCCTCKKPVSSASYRLCVSCAKSRGQCRCCRSGLHLSQATASGHMSLVRFV